MTRLKKLKEDRLPLKTEDTRFNVEVTHDGYYEAPWKATAYGQIGQGSTIPEALRDLATELEHGAKAVVADILNDPEKTHALYLKLNEV